jgi:tripeptidyl-peptidase I
MKVCNKNKYGPRVVYLGMLTGCTVSDPSHARYGQHLTQVEVNELVKPNDDALGLVHDWLFDHGIEAASLSYSPAKDWIKVSLPVSQAESLLDTEYSVFEHVEGDQIVRTLEWSLPMHLHEHIEVIQPTNSFFRPRAMKSTAKAVKTPAGWHVPKPPTNPSGQSLSQVCNETAVTPLCLRTLYGTLDYEPKAAGKNRIGLNDFLGESNNRSDVRLFLEQFRPEAVAAAEQFEVVVIANGTNNQNQEDPTDLANGVELEGNLDAETILGISWPTPLTAFTTGGTAPFIPDVETPTDTNEPYLTWVQYVLEHPNPPQVISTSYDDDEQTIPKSFATSVCNSFAQLGARGVSLLFASGDSGVGTAGYVTSNPSSCYSEISVSCNAKKIVYPQPGTP